MSTNYLPPKIDPFRSALQKAEMQGYLKIQGMPRLCADLGSNEGDAEVKLAFGLDDQKQCIVHGHVKAKVVLQCQRCLEPIDYVIISDFMSGVVNNQQEALDLPEGYVPVLAEEGMLTISDMVEDELMVNLPIVPMHDPEVCKVKLPYKSGFEEKKENPFNVISILRSKSDVKK